MYLGAWSSMAIGLGFSALIVCVDACVVKRWRRRKWQRLAASGDEQMRALLRRTASVPVSEE